MPLVSAVPPSAFGAGLFMLGVLLVMIAVFSSGGSAKSQQFRVIDEVASGKHGKSTRRLFYTGVLAIGLGMCGAFAGVAGSDVERKKACGRDCTERGYAAATVQGSQERDPPGSGRHSFVACVCTDGPAPDPLEFPAEGQDARAKAAEARAAKAKAQAGPDQENEASR
ncbi:MAG: hypothetical protein KUG77_17775 [Nannocystaceae bacterium]|nr:hypothetical protein [Nannocystaceae bacterium]